MLPHHSACSLTACTARRRPALHRQVRFLAAAVPSPRNLQPDLTSSKPVAAVPCFSGLNQPRHPRDRLHAQGRTDTTVAVRSAEPSLNMIVAPCGRVSSSLTGLLFSLSDCLSGSCLPWRGLTAVGGLKGPSFVVVRAERGQCPGRCRGPGNAGHCRAARDCPPVGQYSTREL